MRVAVAVILVAFIGLAATYRPILVAVNDATRIDASQHVSNLPCGSDQSVQQCPGELECVQDPENPDGPDAFREERVGVDGRAEAYCVTPVFEERFCGLLQPRQGTFQSGGIPDIVTTCFDRYSIAGLLHGLREDGPLAVIDQFIDTDGRGAAWIYEQNLTLLKNDPDSSEVPIDGYFNCVRADAAITQVNTTGREMRITVENTGGIALPNMTLRVLYADDVRRTLPGLAPGATLEQTVSLNSSAGGDIQQFHLLVGPCGMVDSHEIGG